MKRQPVCALVKTARATLSRNLSCPVFRFAVHTCHFPCRFEAKAICSPSGNQLGLKPPAVVICAAFFPSASICQTTSVPAAPDSTTRLTFTRADLVTRLNAQTLTRAKVLRAVVQSREMEAVEFNGAFVAMQYFDYLRRTPDEAGYNAWLNYLSAHPQDFLLATWYKHFGQCLQPRHYLLCPHVYQPAF